MKKLIIISLIMLLGIKAIGQVKNEINEIITNKNNTEMNELRELAKENEAFLLNIRRKIHQNPELRFQEEQTLFLIKKEILEILGYENGTEMAKTKISNCHINVENFSIVINELDGGLVINLTTNANYKNVLFRADIDAVPVEEKTGLSFSSLNTGVSHACGHDTHVAMLLTAFKVIIENKVDLKNNIRFVFQRAEENPIDGTSGGKKLAESGVCENIDRAYALHIWTHAPETPAGTFSSCPGYMLGNSDRIKVNIKAPGGHVAFPNQGSSALEVGLAICEKMKKISLEFPSDSVSLAPAIFQSGTGSNIRPQEAELWFAGRNYYPPQKREEFHSMINARLREVAEQYPDAEITITSIFGHPALFNDEKCYKDAKNILENAGEKTSISERELGGEDFAHYLNRTSGSMWLLNAYQEGSGDHHTNTFNPDESVFWKGVLFWLLLATN